jgi:hypothetical protein
MNQDMPSLARVTLSYVAAEDRIQLCGLDTKGRTIRLWLTARLLTALVPHVLQRQAEFEAQRASSVSDTADPYPVPDAGWEDERAAVTGEHAFSEVLISEIDLRLHHTGLSMVFKGGLEGACASFTLSANALAIWSRGLKGCFEQAGWPTEVFGRVSNEPALAARTAVTIH